MVLKHLPEATVLSQNEQPQQPADIKLLNKGLPAQAISKIRVKTIFLTKKIWNFMLEAKDLKPQAATGYRIKKIFGNRLPGFKKPIVAPITTHEIRNEKYFLDMIKLQPKNLANYDALAKFYVDNDNITDAQDIYLYLTAHEPANAEYQAKLAYCYYHSKKYGLAAEHYKKSIKLDSTQPNRYYNLGLSLEAVENFDEAVKNLEHAVLLEPAPKYFIGLSNAYVRQGETEKAKSILTDALAKNPSHALLQEKLDSLLESELKNPEEVAKKSQIG